ncbi:centrosomal protein of 78 kDa [Daktulosphaira vitifoliae]|uniref:centrosomal protein of 78 kDa n=1 Tax=Daktulosphaira vitifoliae TaxID=58002 RepID=UPI0021A99D09|nr:centrosomal protein of 78 kDa [Daktulosphaira vitifoliae]
MPLHKSFRTSASSTRSRGIKINNSNDSFIDRQESDNTVIKNNFASSYMATCKKNNTRPLQYIKINEKKSLVEISGDRMKSDDWKDVMEALSTDTTTHHVLIKNRRHSHNSVTSYRTFSVSLLPKSISTCSNVLDVTNIIANSLHQMLVKSLAITCLELQNILFTTDALEVLIIGIKNNENLQHLSLAYCRISDNECISLCRILKDKPNLRSLDLTGCSLSPLAAELGLQVLIKKQQMKRHEECWIHSLRSRYANPDVMHGIRRLTLNNNSTLGDYGATFLLEILKDDFYVKALDIQNCGLSDHGAQMALSTLMVNNTLVILDLRKNINISTSMLEKIMSRLYENNINKEDMKKWKWTKLGSESASKYSSSFV